MDQDERRQVGVAPTAAPRWLATTGEVGAGTRRDAPTWRDAGVVAASAPTHGGTRPTGAQPCGDLRPHGAVHGP